MLRAGGEGLGLVANSLAKAQPGSASVLFANISFVLAPGTIGALVCISLNPSLVHG